MKQNSCAIFSDKNNRTFFLVENVVGKKIKLNEYRKIFRDKNLNKILKDEAINESVDAFIKGGLNISQASVSSYVHRNTLIYRINKIKKMTGLDLKKFEDCLIFVNMREIFRMVVKNNDV